MPFIFPQAVLSKRTTSKAIPRILIVLLALVSAASAAAGPRFSGPGRVGLTTGDQWEPSIAADSTGRIFILYPHYGKVAGCDGCLMPTMLLIASDDNGKSWQNPTRSLQLIRPTVALFMQRGCRMGSAWPCLPSHPISERRGVLPLQFAAMSNWISRRSRFAGRACMSALIMKKKFGQRFHRMEGTASRRSE
jgi:hypothetical protein